jgi:hypothetical protein
VAFSYRTLGRNGRLGNQLFQIAGTIGKAHSEGDVSQAFFPKWQYAQYFSVPEQHFLTTIPIDIQDLGREYLQDLSLFEECGTYVRNALKASSSANELLLSTFSELARSEGHKTAVHVRRGDYMEFGFWFPLCPIHYYTHSMMEISDEHPDTEFLVFSDDPDWCTHHFGELEHVTVMSIDGVNSVDREIAEFTLMRNCDAFIISNSTFSWWAAYLSESDTVITPNRWYNEGLSHLDHSVFTPNHWRQRSIDPIGPYQPRYVTVTESTTGLIVTDQRNKSVHLLNASASLIFELCNGSNTENHIINIMNQFLTDTTDSEVIIDVQNLLKELREREIVVDATVPVE